MSLKMCRFSIISLLLLLFLVSDAFAAKNLSLTSLTGKGVVEVQPFGSEAWYELSENASMALDNNAIIALRAVPEPGYGFTLWTGNVNNTSSAETYIEMNDSNQRISVVFSAQNLVTVNLEGLGSGKVTLAATDDSQFCTIYSSGETCAFADNKTVDLTAIPSGGSTFSHWSGVDSVTDGIGRIAIGTEDRTVSATFNPAASTTKTLSLYFVGDGTGSVTVNGTTTSSDQAFAFNTGTSVTLTANPSAGDDFIGWSGDLASDSSSITLSLDSDMTIKANFDDPAVSSVVAGCATSVGTNYSSGFDATDFSLTDVSVVDGTSLRLDPGDALDPNSIVIPFEQEIAVTFLYEGAGYDSNDLGWLYAHEDPATTDPRPIYTDINDNNNDGVLDLSRSDTSAGVSDINGDGTINALDNRISLGTFQGGEEIVFTLTAGYHTTAKPPTFYTKTAWNPDTWDGSCASDSFTKTYYLGLPLTEAGCTEESNWMNQPAIDRLNDLFNLSFTATDTQTLDIVRDAQFSHVIVGAPADKPNEWILGWEDLSGGGDTDHNDMIFQIERKNGGSVELLASEAITPLEANAFFTAVTFEVIDQMPGSGASQINYEVSVDGGSNWETISAWDIVKRYPLDGSGNPITSTDLENDGVDISDSWTPGDPETTYRSVRIDFAGMDLSGDQLIWRANFTSDNEAYRPTIKDVQIDAEVATNGEISRSTPIIQSNVLFDASYETPASSWTDKELRGHLRAMRIYDPTNTGATDYVELWDAAEELQSKEPSNRTIKYPEMTVTSVSGEQLQDSAGNNLIGDGTTATFSGTLAHAPLLATTLKITDSRETFVDGDINSLFGSLSQGATGTINRYTGEFEVTFDQPPNAGVPITASYSYYVLTGNLVDFNGTNVGDDELAIDSSTINSSACVSGSEPIYDFNGDCSFTSADGDWLLNWTRGYKDGVSSKKEGILGPIDHSTPAMVTPPGRPSWYYGTSITLTERSAYDTFKDDNAERRSIVVVGSRDGMLHAFDAGAFRWGDNTLTTGITEKRGHFLWPDKTVSNYDDVQDWWTALFAELGANIDPPYFGWDDTGGKLAPDYGTGEEIWAFIPANLMPRLKNNLLGGEDRAYVDASPSVADVYIDADDDGDKEWRTVVLSAEGNGGDTIFCLDVTNTASPAFLWEFSDPELFRSRSSPAIASIGRIYDINAAETKWVAFFVSGRNYDNSFPSIYMVDIDTGTVLNKFLLEAIDAGQGGVPSGQPAIVDSDGNGYIDRLYIGTDKGYLYKVNLPDSPSAAGHPSVVLVNADFTDESGNTVPETQRNHPIYGSPSVVVDNGLYDTGNIDYNIRIFFGTGDSPYYDEDIDTGNTQYHFFAYIDKAGKGETSNRDIRLNWFFELPAGHRIFASAFAAAGRVYFGTATGETENPCEGANEGRIYAFSYDGVSDLNDTLGDEGWTVGDSYTGPVVEDEHLYIRTPDGIKSFGDGQYNNEVKKGGLPSTEATYWREIF